ncbi:hypothetical protein SAMN05660462_02290 [Proteiniborus ethanoligenes]|uniref:Membrane transport protein n=1 Tax=Proteiniborus ethanoligenes TaxID=415015 RepID=A0A1H3RBI4_9FIRM|nr:malate permease [Proteiniborus ethanoligenes]SDZ22621.1 hypothetical protein SAMN05660462_02290 [Proteiniborus ethanoligenes]
MTDIAAKIIPILLLISLGCFFRYKNTFKQTTIDEVKKLVIDIAFSAVLFITFLNMELRKEYFLVSIIIFLMLTLFYFAGIMLNMIKLIKHSLIPFFSSGFAFGFLGIPLFSTIFGVENLGKLSILGIGHEFFIWLLFYTLLKIKLGNQKFSVETGIQIFKSPVIISITLGIILNLTGLGTSIHYNPIAKGLYTTIEYLSNLSTPLILIIIGYGLRFNKKYMKQSVLFIMIRFIVILSIGYFMKIFVINKIVAPDLMFDYAYFTFLILPSPLTLPIFVGASSTQEYEELANNTVVLNTVVSIVIFIIFVLTINI